jgi:signal transduction histidine kinase
MARSSVSPLARWLPIISAVFAIFVLFQLGLFAWLILRSLSQREVDRILLSAQQDATQVADQLAAEAEAQGEDLFTAVAVAQETMTYIDDVLLQRDFVDQVEVRNKEGVIVLQREVRTRIPEGGAVTAADLEPGELPGQVRREASEQTAVWEVTEKIGDLGALTIRFNRVEMELRIAELRADLVRRSAFIGGVTLVMLLTAYFVIWLLLRRARRLEDQAKDTERMAYLGTLAAGLAHEIRNPLNSLSLNMQMLEEDLEDEQSSGGSSKRLLAITRSEIERLEHLATNFLSYARSRPLEREGVTVRSLLEEAAASLEGELEASRVLVQIVDETDGATLFVDPGQIHRLLQNLIKNSMGAMEGLNRPPRVVLRGRWKDGWVALEVEDQGRGMSREESRRMFDLFYSTRKGGTGLGLAIVDRIARAHGGKLEVESAEGVGTLVRLLLSPKPEAGTGEFSISRL